MATKTFRNTTYAKVSFFTHDLVANRYTAHNEILIDFPKDSALMSWGFQRDIGQPAGVVTIALKNTTPEGQPSSVTWTDVLSEGDWWCIDVVKNGVSQGMSFGKIDSVSLGMSAGPQGGGQAQIVVQGRSFGFALADTPLYFNPFDPNMDNAVGVNMIKVVDAISGSPHTVITSLIEGMFGLLNQTTSIRSHTEVPSQLGLPAPLNTWIDQLDRTLASFGGTVQENLRGQVFAPEVWTPSGEPSLWAFVNQWRNPLMNELFIDESSLPGIPKKAHLVLREKPFVNATQGFTSPWFHLTTWDIDARTIKALNITKGHNRLNHYTLLGDLAATFGKQAYALYPPVVDLASVQRYGLRRLEDTTNYINDVGGDLGFEAASKQWLHLVLSWNVLNHEYWVGTINLGELRSEIRIGQKVRILNGPPLGYKGLPSDRGIASNALTFYVEGVDHQYVAGAEPTAITTLKVSRGYPESERVAAITAAMLNFVGVVPASSVNNPTGLNTLTEVEKASIDAISFQPAANLIEIEEG